MKDVISLLKAWSLCVSQSQITREGVLTSGTHLVPLTYGLRLEYLVVLSDIATCDYSSEVGEAITDTSSLV